MSEPVVIKMNKYGMTLQLDSEIDFEGLIRYTCQLFATNRAFFGPRTMILELEGRELSTQEKEVIIQAIELNSDVRINLLMEHDAIEDARMMNAVDRFYHENYFENATIIRGSVTPENDVVSDTASLVILGDVKKGAKVTSKGNVIVFGTISGEVHAGYSTNNECYVVCNELASDEVSIGTCASEIVYKKKWSLRVKKSIEPVCLAVFNDEILCEPIASGLLKKIKAEN